MQTNPPTWRVSHCRLDHRLSRPSSEVWPHFADIRKWITDYTFEAIDWPTDGPVARGARSKVFRHEDTSESSDMYYIMDVYELDPGRDVFAWLTAPKPEAFSLSDLSAFYHWFLRDSDGGSTVTIEQFLSEKPMSTEDGWVHGVVDPDYGGSWEDAYREAFDSSWGDNLDTLTALVEESAR